MRISKRIFIIIISFMLVFSSIPNIAEPVYAKRVRINKKHMSIYVGKKKTLRLKHCKRKIKWRSTNKRVATVSKKGKVKAKKPGVTTIIAKRVGKKGKFRCKVRVKAPAYTHVYSHRGDSKHKIEHTIASYDYAIKKGSHNIEQDIVISRNGTIYVSHDLTATRIAGVDRYYSNMTDEEIDSLRTADGQKILKLSEVFDRYKKSVSYIVEFKVYNSIIINEFMKLVDERGLQNNIVVQCFDAGPIEMLEKYYPDMPKMLLCKTYDGFIAGLENDVVDIISVQKSLMNKGNLNLAHKKGKIFNVYTLKTKEEHKTAVKLNVDSYFSNDTELALKTEWKYR